MQACSFTSAQRPVLLPNEVIIQVQPDVGVYKGWNDKLADYQQGRIYLTSHRIIYMDATKASCWELVHVQRFDTKPGFLTNSPKIHFFLDIPSSPSLQKPLSSWTCTVCSELNTSDTQKCYLCGVVHQMEAIQLDSKKTCLQCTFDNHADVNECEMCGFSLNMKQEPPTSHLYMLSFRKGGMTEFAKSLGFALAKKAWIPPPVASHPKPTPTMGISGIVQQVDQSQKGVHHTLSQAFTDLDALMQKAADMVKLAGSITSKLTGSALDEPELASFRTFLVNLGIDHPVTRETAGDAYREELARQLAEFLDKIPCESMMPLVDVYCLFNRARGVALVSPDDLYKSCLLFDTLGLPYHLRTFDSGLVCIQSYILFITCRVSLTYTSVS